MMGVIEWIEHILKHFEHTLRLVGIYGVVGVAYYPYHFGTDVHRAFCELWGPLTNKIHHGAEKLASPFTTWKQLVTCQF